MKPNVRVNSKIGVLFERLRHDNGVVVSASQVSRDTGLAKTTVLGLMRVSNPPRRIDLHVIERIMEYFRIHWGKIYKIDDVFSMEASYEAET